MFAACGITHRRMLPTGSIVGALYYKLKTQSSAPEDERNYRPKHVELIGIFNKQLLLHLVGCLYYCISDARSYKHQMCTYIISDESGGSEASTNYRGANMLHIF